MINIHFSGRLVAAGAPVADGGHRLLLAEPGASGGKLVEPVHAPCLADLGDQIGFLSPQQWPGVQADPPAQALDCPAPPEGADAPAARGLGDRIARAQLGGAVHDRPRSDPLNDVELVDRCGQDVVENLPGVSPPSSYRNGDLVVASAISCAAASRMGSLMITIPRFLGADSATSRTRLAFEIHSAPRRAREREHRTVGLRAAATPGSEARITDGGRGGSGVPGAPPDSPG
jgi:hypothetical protein